MRVEEFLEALERVGNGGAAFDPEVVRQLLARTSHTDPRPPATAAVCSP
jgi:DNA-binding NarL/FixJ family response regulator